MTTRTNRSSAKATGAARKRTRPKRPSITGQRGRPRRGTAFTDAVLRAKIRALHMERQGRAEAATLYEAAVDAKLFSRRDLQRLARRAGIEYVRGALGENNPATGFPYSYAVPIEKGCQLWIAEEAMDVDDGWQHLKQLEKGVLDYHGQYRRVWERFAARWGADRMPPLVQMTFEGMGANGAPEVPWHEITTGLPA